MDYGEFINKAIIHDKKKENHIREFRLLLSAVNGFRIRPEKIISMPGDWDYIPAQRSQDENIAILQRTGVWQQLQKLNKQKKN